MESAVAGELKNKALQSWWKQCLGDANKSNRIPLLVMTKANEPVYILMWRDHFDVLDLGKHTTVVFNVGDLQVMLWKEFLKMPYGEVKEVGQL